MCFESSRVGFESGIGIVVVVDSRWCALSCVDGVAKRKTEVQRQPTPLWATDKSALCPVVPHSDSAHSRSRRQHGFKGCAVDVCAWRKADLGDHHAISLEANPLNVCCDVHWLARQRLGGTKGNGHAKLFVVDDRRGWRNGRPRAVKIRHELHSGGLRVGREVRRDAVITSRKGYPEVGRLDLRPFLMAAKGGNGGLAINLDGQSYKYQWNLLDILVNANAISASTSSTRAVACSTRDSDDPARGSGRADRERQGRLGVECPRREMHVIPGQWLRRGLPVPSQKKGVFVSAPSNFRCF